MPEQSRRVILKGGDGSSPDQAVAPIVGGNAPTADSMRELRRLHASSVTAVTYVDDRGYRGVTVTAFTVVSLDPPRVLVCLDVSTEALAAVQARDRFAVNLLSDHQKFLADRFAGRAPLVNTRFDGVPHRITGLGNPVLLESLAWFDCRVVTVSQGGDHNIVVGDVKEAGRGTGSLPLLYFDGTYRDLGEA